MNGIFHVLRAVAGCASARLPVGATIAIEPRRAERPSLRPAHDSHLVDAHVAEPGAQVCGGEQRVRSVERLVQRVRVEAVSLRKGAARAGGAG